MGANASAVVGLILQALTQAQQYQLTLARAQAEGRDVTDEELAAARAQTKAAIDALAVQPAGG